MPLVSYAVARRAGAVCTRHRTPQLTVPLPKYNGPNRSTNTGTFRTRSTWRFVVALLLTTGHYAGAQRVTGPWDDASIAPRGILRIGISPRFGQWRDRFSSDGTQEPLGAQFSRDSLGPALFPFMSGLAPALTTLTGLASPALSLGNLATQLDVTEVTTAISLDYGVTSRVGLRAVVPYVKNRVHVAAAPNATGFWATLGFNPAQTIAGARDQNDLVVTALGAAASRLTSELARCMGIVDATCTAINADRTGAMTLVQTADQVSGAVAAVYGTPTVSGGLYAPVAGGALHSAVDARLTQLNTQFRGFLGAPASGEWIAPRPVPAVPIAAADFAELLGNPDFGISARPLGDYEHSHVGDIEVGLKLKLLDTFGPVATAPLPRAGAMRVSAAGIYRLPTAQLDLPHDFTDVGTGDRQADLELQGFLDFAFGPRLWASSVVRLGIQRPDRLVRRITDNAVNPFPELARELEVGRDLGDMIELEVAPRYVPNDEFAVSALYRYRSKGSDSYDGSFQVTSLDGTPLILDASVLGIGTNQTEQVLGFAVTYSTVRGYSQRRARWPLEVSFVHSQMMSGRNIPRQHTNAIAFRFYRPTRGNVLRPVIGDQ